MFVVKKNDALDVLVIQHKISMTHCLGVVVTKIPNVYLQI